MIQKAMGNPLDLLLDKDWRMSHLYKISTKEGGAAVIFKPNRAQKDLNEALKTHRRIIVLKSRQLGITTDICIYAEDEVLFRKNVNALSILQTRDHAIAAFDNKVRFAWDNFDPKLREELGWRVDTERANQLTFGFGDGDFSTYSVGTSGRSGTFHFVHISEFGSLCADRPLDAKEIVTGTFPSVPNDGTIVIESTANGELGFFPDIWNGAVKGENGWYPLFFNWRYDDGEIEKCTPVDKSRIPQEFLDLQALHSFTEKELAYYYGKWLMLNRDWSLLRQEYPTTAQEAFMSSGEKLYDSEAIGEYEALASDGKKVGNTTVFQGYKPGHRYVIGADPSEGIGGDHSAAVVWDIDGIKPQVVATFASNTSSPEDFAYVLREFAMAYGEGVICVERNNHGHAVLAVLKRIYDEAKLFYEQDGEPSLRDANPSRRYGLESNLATKPMFMTMLAQAVRDRSVLVPSKPLLMEMRLCPRGETTRIS